MDTAVKNIKIENLTSPRYVKPYQISFDLCGKPVRWECVKAHDSVSALLYHEDKDAFLLVKQFRPAVWFNIQSAKTGPLNLTQEGEEGYTYELCAGLMDKGKSEEQTVIEEIAEETGFAASKVERITSTRGALGFGGARQTMFFAAINDDMKVGEGGGIDGENIELAYVPVKDARKFMFDESKSKAAGLLFAFMWFFDKFNR